MDKLFDHQSIQWYTNHYNKITCVEGISYNEYQYWY